MTLVMERVMTSQPKYTLPLQDNHKNQFDEKNKSLKLFYNPIVYSKIASLATKVYETLGLQKLEWNGSILNLYESILNVTSEQQTNFIALLNEYVNESTTDTSTTHTMMTVIWYFTIVSKI